MNKHSLIIRGVVLIFIGVIFLILELFVFNDKKTSNEEESDYINRMQIVVNNEVFDVKLENNTSSKSFIEKLKNGEITILMHDYGNFEKVGDLGFSLPTNDQNITTVPGDLILYQGNKITLYYDTNTWNFTKLGHIDKSKDELKTILGDKDVTIVFRLNNIK